MSKEVWNERTARLIGEDAERCLAEARVLVVGLGGVGGYAAEMLARAGVGHLTLLDADAVDVTNVNRQLIALHSTVGKSKVELFAERFRDINPDVEVEKLEIFLTSENLEEVMAAEYDFVIDAIDTVAPKVSLLAYCLTHKIPVVSSMGAGGRLDPSAVGVCDLWETRDDGLAKAVRTRLKKLEIRRPLKVVASTERPASSSLVEVNTANKRTSFGTIATIPSLFGIYLASHVIDRLLRSERKTDAGTPKL